jgi:hypothetical protein
MSHVTASSLTLVLARARVAALMQDESPTRAMWTDAQRTLALQYWYILWYERFNNRLAQYAGGATFGSWTTGVKKMRSLDNAILRYRHVHLEPNSTDIGVGPELRITNSYRVRLLQQTGAQTGTPTCVGFEPVAGITKAASGDSTGYWDAWIYPVPTSTVYLSAFVRTTPYVPVADADVFDCTPAEAQIVTALAAIEGASLGGRDSEFIENRWRVIPEEVQAVMRAEMATRVTQTQVQAGAPVP